MTHGGRRQGAGRRKGAHNKASARREWHIAQSGPTPLDVMIDVMRHYFAVAKRKLKQKTSNENEVKAAFGLALDAANKAAPFVHPRLAAVELSAKLDPSRLTEEEIQLVEPILRKALVRGHGGDPDTSEAEIKH